MNVPNIISLARLCVVPIIFWLILSGNMEIAFWVTLVAAISDALDGIIAKSFNLVTVLGGYLDPIADKTLLVFTYIALWQQGYLPDWLVILVVFRDIVIITGALSFHLMTQSLEMSPIMLSKINTFAQLVLALSILASEGLSFDDSSFRQMMIYGVGASTVFSGCIYIIIWSQKASDLEKRKI